LNHAELVKIHHELDIFIFPSNIDSWAQVVIEAMACGSPILVSENTGAKDAVAQGGGVVLPVGNLTAWINAIEHFYNNRFLLKKVGEQAALVSKQYTWEAYHEQVFDIMTDIVSRTSVREGEAAQISINETI
jgi:glycosyltransferase involved in cell wall biosynthesis